MDGLGVQCSRFTLELAEFQPGSTILTSLRIFPGLLLKKLEGCIAYIRPMNKSITRLGIHLNPGQDRLNALQRYIDRRQVEILRELEHNYTLSFEPRRVEELYF